MQHPPRGDERELFQLHNRKLVNVIHRRFRLSEEEARDVVQFAWLKFLEKQPARTNVFGWLYTTAKHEVYAAPDERCASAPASYRSGATTPTCRLDSIGPRSGDCSAR
jgi:hypothetical protein